MIKQCGRIQIGIYKNVCIDNLRNILAQAVAHIVHNPQYSYAKTTKCVD
jgi:hypothetical protein